MGANDELRRRNAMLAIDKKMDECRQKYGPRTASKMKCDIIDEVANEYFYAYRTLERYHNAWVKKEGIFACERH